MKFSLEIVEKNGKVKIEYPGGDSVWVAASSSGLVFSPNFNDRHFTLASEGGGPPYFHITRDGTDERLAEDHYGSESEYLADMYGGMAVFGLAKPIGMIDVEFVWEMDLDEFRALMEEKNVIECDEKRFYFSFTRMEAFFEGMDESELRAYLERVYTPVELEEAWKGDGRMFFSPNFDRFLLFRPGPYVVELPMEDPVNVFEGMRGARVIDVMYQMFEHPVSN